ncbi:MAG: hypothetical protein JWM11_2982 [Planctomycetaceae bacterium]|nr:hypothetical protein [Planctomycetaceae bacterium]
MGRRWKGIWDDSGIVPFGISRIGSGSIPVRFQEREKPLPDWFHSLPHGNIVECFGQGFRQPSNKVSHSQIMKGDCSSRQ